MLLDLADWHALVGDAVLLAPGAEDGQEPAVDVGRIGALVAPDLLEGNPVDELQFLQHAIQPAAEVEEAHTPSLEPPALVALEP